VLEPLGVLRARLAEVEWTPEAIHAAVVATAEEAGLKLGKVAQPLRVAISGGGVSPPIDVTVHLVGRELTLARIDRALQYIQAGVGG
jgi:glutamyl-tRNA synthetase